MDDMKPVEEIRRDNLQQLVQQSGGISSLNTRLGRSARDSTFNQILNRSVNSKGGKPKSMGPRMARSIEEALSLQEGWMDTPHSGDSKAAPAEVSATDITIQQYDAAGSMGNGLDLPDQPGVIQNLRVNKEWLSKNIRAYSAAKNLCVVTGFGDSMQPMFNPGDPLLVDLGVTSVEFDAVYFFRVDNLGYVKRLQRIPTEDGLVIRAISENKDAYDPFNITEKMDFQVIGRVLKVWRSQEF